MHSAGLHFASRSVSVTRVIDWTGKVYRSVSYYAGIILGGALFVLVIMPLLRLALFLTNAYLKRHVSTAYPKVTTATHYRRLRKVFNRLSDLDIKTLSVAGSPIIVRRMGLDALNRQIAQLANLRDQFKQRILDALDSLDGGAGTQGTLFNTVSEDTLWTNRTKAYEYKL